MIISCNKQEIQKPFIVSEYNRNLEKHFEEAKKKNPELSTIPEIKLFDYPKGKINFIFSENGKINFYYEDMWDIICSVGLDKLKPEKRTLDCDSLHSISFNEIRSFLEKSKYKKEYQNHRGELYPLFFAFEKDTISKYNIQKLLNDADSLGYHQYDVRRMAPFEKKCIQ